MLTLDVVSVGQSVRLVRFSNASLSFRHRFLAMGAIPGCLITVVRIAPLGCPIQVRLRGSLLSLRKKECQQLEVETIYVGKDKDKSKECITENGSACR